jgi:uncharacterized protein (TIGR02284 family)
MEYKKTLNALNKLVEIHNDRIEGYETFTKETDEHELKNLFSQFAQTSLRCKHELMNEIYMLGGNPTEGTKIADKFFRVLMDVKTAFSGNDHKAMLSSCEYGEEHALNTYEKVMGEDTEYLSHVLQNMIRNQYSLIKSDYYRVKSIYDLTTV